MIFLKRHKEDKPSCTITLGLNKQEIDLLLCRGHVLPTLMACFLASLWLHVAKRIPGGGKNRDGQTCLKTLDCRLEVVC